MAASTRVRLEATLRESEASHRERHTLLWLPREACLRPQLPGCGAIDEPPQRDNPEVANIDVLTATWLRSSWPASASRPRTPLDASCLLESMQTHDLPNLSAQSLDCAAVKAFLMEASPRPLIPSLCKCHEMTTLQGLVFGVNFYGTTASGRARLVSLNTSQWKEQTCVC